MTPEIPSRIPAAWAAATRGRIALLLDEAKGRCAKSEIKETVLFEEGRCIALEVAYTMLRDAVPTSLDSFRLIFDHLAEQKRHESARQPTASGMFILRGEAVEFSNLARMLWDLRRGGIYHE